MAGVTPEGFEGKTIEQLQDDLTASHRANLDPAIDNSVETPLGQIDGIVSSSLAEGWEALGATYRANDIDAATDEALDTIGALTGVRRPQDTHSRVTLTLEVEAGTTVPAGSLVALETRDDIQFETDDAVENATGETVFAEVLAIAVNAGVILAPAGQLTEIVTPIVGWLSVTNELDARPGRLRAKDPEYRTLIKGSRSARGLRRLGAIRGQVLELNRTLYGAPLRDVIVRENTLSRRNAAGIPGNSIEVLIYDNEDTENDLAIATRVWEAKAEGVRTFGNVEVAVEIRTGVFRPIFFSRPTPIEIYVSLTVRVSPGAPENIGDLIQAAVIERGRAQSEKVEEIIALSLEGAPLTVEHVIDVTSFAIGKEADPEANTNLQISLRERADYDSTRTVVTVVRDLDQ